MTILAEPLVTPAPADEDPRIVHVVCAIHTDDALCGQYLPEGMFVSDDEPTTCPLCALAEQHGMVCLHLGCPGKRPAERRGWWQRLRGASS